MDDIRPVGQLREIRVDEIQRNPENPRLYFRPEELESLLTSIAQFGVQVPITVYDDGEGYRLIDGERRWRCALKLNIRRIPALVQPKPSPLDNLLLMFNIHALREQWDYLTIANKLPDVISRFAQERGKEPNERELSEATGLTRGQIRRCRLLLDIPRPFIEELHTELQLPKQQQKLSEDLLIEMERALKTVERRLPSAVRNKDRARRTLIDKFRRDVITNVTDFRKLAKIATSVEKFDVRQRDAERSVSAILDSANDVGIAQVYAEHYELHYDERKVEVSARSIISFLETIDEVGVSELSEELRETLARLRDAIDVVLEG